jgi:hypothetical protein
MDLNTREDAYPKTTTTKGMGYTATMRFSSIFELG